MNTKIRRMSIIAISTALMCVISPLTIPTQPVPITMATFTLWTVAMILPWKDAVIATALFVLLGAMGLPVFSNGGGGLEKVLGPTGGYIWAFSFTPIFFEIARKFTKNKYIERIFGVVTSFAFICAIGIAWMMVYYAKAGSPKPFLVLLKKGYLVFWWTTLIKGVMASIVADRVKLSY